MTHSSPKLLSYKTEYTDHPDSGNQFRSLAEESCLPYLQSMAGSNNNSSIGIDIVSQQRIHDLLTRFPNRFPDRILGRQEKIQWEERKRSLRYLAGRFAAKEALIKSLRGKLDARPPYSSMEIVNESDGAPRAEFSKEIAELLRARTFSVSISHDGDYACAVAMCLSSPE